MKASGCFGLGQWVLLAAGFLSCAAAVRGADPDPAVSNVRASQRSGTRLVDIDYDLADADSGSLTVTIAVSTNAGASYFAPASSLSGAVGPGVAPGAGRRATWNAPLDLPARLFSNLRVQVTACDVPPAPSGMVLIPAGSFTMGNCMNSSEGYTGELPLHTVYVSAFYMDRHEVTKALWDEVKAWNGGNGYSYENPGAGKAADHPVQTVNWRDCVKWCNARSQKEGLVPCYYNESGLTTIYKSGTGTPYPNWAANGYRLPTEAEWEKAARGGAGGHRFPWSDADTINWSRANYYASPSAYSYDVNPTSDYNPAWTGGGDPYTTPVGSFAANGYGLYDMAGNVWEWCWDWYSSSYYGSSPGTDPRGATSGSSRVIRGGCWNFKAHYCRAAVRFPRTPDGRSYNVGFRCVRPPGQ